MTDIFGAQWSSQHGEIDHDDTWLRGLSDFTPQDLSIGLTACATMKPDEDGKFWAPSLPQFRDMCKPKPYPYATNFPSLPTPDISKEEQLAHIAKIREALK